MKSVLSKVSALFLGSFDQTALLAGTSDILIVRWKSGYYASTPFLACFGAQLSGSTVSVYINDILINGVSFTLDKFGYANPLLPSQQILERLHLRYGRNSIKFQLDNNKSLSAEVYLYSEYDKFLVSDFDGTMTKNDLGGLFHNIKNRDYLHDGYYELVDKVERRGYRILWLTMRSLPLYKFSKDYIRHHTNFDGILLTEPEEFFPALKKQILKKTGNIKTNMMRVVRQLFPTDVNPFVGGLGNRQNDAIAYLAAGVPKQAIFIVDKNSEVHNLADNNSVISYRHISKHIDQYFPHINTKQFERQSSILRDKRSSTISSTQSMTRKIKLKEARKRKDTSSTMSGNSN